MQSKLLNRGAIVSALGLMVAAFASVALATGTGSPALAASAACTNAPFHANVEASAGVAFVDVGAANSASFVCINTPGFAGGSSNELTANGTYGNGCYFVEGIGTSVVAVYWELPDVRPDCQMITNIDVGTGTVASPTPATTVPTAPATAPATTVPTTVPTATPTRAATVAPTQTGAAPTSMAPASPTMRPPAPPATGSGAVSESNTNQVVFLGLGFTLLALSGTALVFQRRR